MYKHKKLRTKRPRSSCAYAYKCATENQSFILSEPETDEEVSSLKGDFRFILSSHVVINERCQF